VIVLDTQAWLWWLHDPERLSARVRRVIRDAEENGRICVSAISVWEIATKQALGKLELPLQLEEWFRVARSYPGIMIEPVSAEDAMASASLPGQFHKDPADRLIVALARRRRATLITADALIRDYPHVATLW
jgi:PIN domain nuclease of toxin-antitoxin system